MRVLLALLLLSLAGCGDSRAPVIENIEIRVSGWSAVDISLNRNGKGKYHLSEPRPEGKGGSFSISPQQFDQIQRRLESFRQTAVPFSDQSARKFALYECPEGIPFATDAGGVYIHWAGPKSDQHYLADLGWDPETNAARNKELLAIVESLPVPLNW